MTYGQATVLLFAFITVVVLVGVQSKRLDALESRQPPPITITEQNGRICLENTETGSVACLITVERE